MAGPTAVAFAPSLGPVDRPQRLALALGRGHSRRSVHGRGTRATKPATSGAGLGRGPGRRPPLAPRRKALRVPGALGRPNATPRNSAARRAASEPRRRRRGAPDGVSGAAIILGFHVGPPSGDLIFSVLGYPVTFLGGVIETRRSGGGAMHGAPSWRRARSHSRPAIGSGGRPFSTPPDKGSSTAGRFTSWPTATARKHSVYLCPSATGPSEPDG